MQGAVRGRGFLDATKYAPPTRIPPNLNSRSDLRRSDRMKPTAKSLGLTANSRTLAFHRSNYFRYCQRTVLYCTVLYCKPSIQCGVGLAATSLSLSSYFRPVNVANQPLIPSYSHASSFVSASHCTLSIAYFNSLPRTVVVL